MMRGYFDFDGLDRFSRFGTNTFGGQYMWIGMVLHILFVIAVFVLIVWIVKKLLSNQKPKTVTVDSSKALEIIKERYAKGEITKEEFENLRKDLL
jgi:putative membrane protein